MAGNDTDMENKYFVKFMMHSPEFLALIIHRPTAFVLLALIVYRARKVLLDINDGIEIGEAFIGDYEKYGATLQSYRTDKKYLEKFNIATFKATNRGTVAKIVNASIFDISRVSSTNKLTDKQQSNNMQSTTKQEVRSEIKEGGASLAIEKNSFFQGMPISSSNEASQSSDEIEEQPATYRSNNSNGGSVNSPKIDKEEYWDINAPRIAGQMGIEQEDWKYINGKVDWLKKAKTPTPNSIKAFLESANDWDPAEGY